MNNKNLKRRIYFIASQLILIVAFNASITAQTTAFNYQGKLTDGGSPASGNYLLQFKLFNAASDGTQSGATFSDVSVTATQGVFTTQLDFGVSAFPGADRFLEIAVKKNAGDPFTTLTPRQQINSSPYSIRTLSAAQADVALDSNKLGGFDASQYVTTTSGNTAFVKNSTTQQTGNFNISGNGTTGGTLQANAVIAQTGTGVYGLTQTDGTTTIGTYVGGSASGAAGGWFGTLTNHPLHFFSNGGQPKMTIDTAGNVGIGTSTPVAKLHVAGNAVQDLNNGGMVKALLSVRSNGTLERCYNGITGVPTGNCGFTVNRSSNGTYDVSFGFQVSDRFISVTARPFPPVVLGAVEENTGANFRFTTQNNTLVFVNTFITAGSSLSRTDAAFMLIVY